MQATVADQRHGGSIRLARFGTQCRGQPISRRAEAGGGVEPGLRTGGLVTEIAAIDRPGAVTQDDDARQRFGRHIQKTVEDLIIRAQDTRQFQTHRGHFGARRCLVGRKTRQRLMQSPHRKPRIRADRHFVSSNAAMVMRPGLMPRPIPVPSAMPVAVAEITIPEFRTTLTRLPPLPGFSVPSSRLLRPMKAATKRFAGWQRCPMARPAGRSSPVHHDDPVCEAHRLILVTGDDKCGGADRGQYLLQSGAKFLAQLDRNNETGFRCPIGPRPDHVGGLGQIGHCNLRLVDGLRNRNKGLIALVGSCWHGRCPQGLALAWPRRYPEDEPRKNRGGATRTARNSA